MNLFARLYWLTHRLIYSHFRRLIELVMFLMYIRSSDQIWVGFLYSFLSSEEHFFYVCLSVTRYLSWSTASLLWIVCHCLTKQLDFFLKQKQVSFDQWLMSLSAELTSKLTIKSQLFVLPAFVCVFCGYIFIYKTNEANIAHSSS